MNFLAIYIIGIASGIGICAAWCFWRAKEMERYLLTPSPTVQVFQNADGSRTSMIQLPPQGDF